MTSTAFSKNETLKAHKKTSGTANQLLRNSNLEPGNDQELLLKAYTNLTSGSYLMLYIQSHVDRRVELQDMNGKINPIIIHPKAQVHFGLALADNSSLILTGNILGTNDNVFLNQHSKVRIQPENNIYKQAHIVVAASDEKQTGKISPYTSNQGGDSHQNVTSQIQSSLSNIGSKGSQQKDMAITMAFRNTLGAVVELSDITGAVEPIVLLPYQMKTMRLVVKKSWPMIFHASSENQIEEVLVNGQRQLRIYLPAEEDAVKEVSITSRNTAASTPGQNMQAVMLSINNTLKQPVVLFDVSNTMRPLVVPENRICQIGFFVKNAGFVVLSGITLGEKTSGVAVNGDVQVAVQASQNPAQQNLITVTELSKNESKTSESKDETAPSGGSNATKNVNNTMGGDSGQAPAGNGERFVMLSIHNKLDLPAKFIELTGAHKPFLVPAHADAQLGFSVIRHGPIVLRAINAESNEELALNKQNFLRIEPTDATSKSTDVVVSAKTNESKMDKRLVRPSLPKLILMHK